MVNCLKNPLQIGNGSEQRIIKGSQSVDGLPEPADVGGKGHQHADGDSASGMVHPGNSQHIDEGRCDSADNIDRRSHEEIKPHRSHPRLTVPVAEPVKNPAVLLLPHKGLGHADSVYTLRNVSVQVGLLIALNLPCPSLPLLDKDYQDREHGQTAQTDQCQSHVNTEHEEQDEKQITQVCHSVYDSVA